MGGVDVGGGGKGETKSLDTDINMIPFIDLLMVTIAFLLITAVWTHMARINADAQVPGPPRPTWSRRRSSPEKQLHVMMRSRTSSSSCGSRRARSIRPIDVPRKDDGHASDGAGIVRFPDLAAKIESEWKAKGQHSRRDGQEARSGDPAHRQQDAVQSTSSASSTRSTSRIGT